MLSGGQLVKVVLRLICLAGVWRICLAGVWRK